MFLDVFDVFFIYHCAMKIKNMCEEERPRERLISAGPESLGNGELLAILLRGGTREKSVLELAQELLFAAGGRLSGLFAMGQDRMGRIKGIGPCKAASVQAALELGRRFLREDSAAMRKPVVSPRMAYDYMRSVFKGLDHEECWVVFLNPHNYLLGRRKLSMGGGTATVIDINQIVRLALDKAASGIILMHNHPAGNPHPSSADLRQTDMLHAACKTVQVSLIDHIVVSDGSFFSCSDDRMYLCDSSENSL